MSKMDETDTIAVFAFRSIFRGARNIDQIVRQRRKKRALIRVWAYAGAISATLVKGNMWAQERTHERVYSCHRNAPLLHF